MWGMLDDALRASPMPWLLLALQPISCTASTPGFTKVQWADKPAQRAHMCARHIG